MCNLSFDMHTMLKFTMREQVTFRLKQYSCIAAVFSRKINTHGSQRKGKLSVVRKKIDHQQLSVESVKAKMASSTLKQFNWENKNLFGEVLTAVQRTCKKIVKKKKRKEVELSSDITYNESCITIENVNAELLAKLTSDVSGKILNFPLMDKLTDEERNSDLVKKVNCLRQFLEGMREDGKYPSVTTILEETMPPERALILENWKKSMIKSMGEDGFKKYQKDLLFNGSSLHQSINTYLSRIPELPVQVIPANSGHWVSLQSVLPLIKEVKLLEEHLTHPFLCYKGVVDCFGRYKDHFVVIDWKTSKKPKMSLSLTYDSPLQIAAYVGALNFDPKFKYMVNKGLIVIAYENGTPATVHFMNETVLLDYWQKWLERLKLYWEKR